MKMLYKYPQAEFPYTRLVEENRRRTKADPEFELIDTGIFDDDRYFDVFVEYAKAGLRRHSGADHGLESRARGGAARSAADDLVPQYLALGTASASWRNCGAAPTAKARESSASKRRNTGTAG